MVRLNKIYTKAGDKGETRLVGGKKVAKDDLRLETYGTVDELNACIGMARTEIARSKVATNAVGAGNATTTGDPGAQLDEVLRRIQNELFNLGSELATLPEDRHPKQPVIEARHATKLEQEIDAWNEHLPELRSFILPGGGAVAATLHLARTVCRRAERLVVSLSRKEPATGAQPVIYLNRLSDALFVMSRHASRIYGEAEPLWEPEKT